MKKRYIAFVISLSILLTSLFAGNVVAQAMATDEVFHLYVKNGNGEPFVGEFYIYGDEVYVSVQTVEKMQIEMAHDSSEPCSLEEVLVQSGLTADFYYNDRLLYVHEYPEYDELLKYMREIYTNKSYNMYYVQTDRYYTASVEIAMLSDCIKNFSFISQVTGSENRKLYEDAFWRIITPDSDADMKILET